MATEVHLCTMCSFSSTRITTLTSHVLRAHRSHPRFHIYCKYCLRSYKKWDSYRKHLHRGCSEIVSIPQINSHEANEDDVKESNEDSVDTSNEDHVEVLSTLDPGYANLNSLEHKMQEAIFVLGIKEQHALSQSAVDQVVSSTSVLVSDLFSSIISNVNKAIPPNYVKVIEEEMMDTRKALFNGISTAFQQNKFFKEHFNLVVSKCFLKLTQEYIKFI